MRFSGRLQIEADPHNWLKADLMVAKGRVELVSASELLGSWSTGQVVAERVEGDRFSLQLGEDRALFIADDALSFSYEAMPQLNKRQLLPVGVMDKLKAGLRGDDSREAVVVNEPTAASSSESPAASTGKRLRELIKEASGLSSAPTEAPASAGAIVEKKAGHSLEGLLHGRSGANAEAPVIHMDIEGPPDDGDLATEDLLERLFDAPDAPERELASSDQPSLPESLWADPVIAKPPPEQLAPEVPVVDTWHMSEPPVDLSPNERPNWGSSLSSRLSGHPVERPSWASPFEATQSESPAQPAEVVDALDRIVTDVKSGALSAEQVNAITALVEAVRQALRAKI
ncbi:MAG: hypothetical protein WD651_14710 [Acidimicrobiia bacterium]